MLLRKLAPQHRTCPSPLIAQLALFPAVMLFLISTPLLGAGIAASVTAPGLRLPQQLITLPFAVLLRAQV